MVILFLGAFAKLRIETIIFFMPVRPSVRLSLAVSAWNNSKMCRENSSFFKIRKNKGYFTWRLFTFATIYRWIILRVRNVWNKICRENQHTFYVQWPFFFFRKSCRLWDNVETYGGAREDADNMAPARGVLGKKAYTRTSTRPCSCTHTHQTNHTRALAHGRKHSYACPHQRARAHTHTHARTHTHRNT